MFVCEDVVEAAGGTWNASNFVRDTGEGCSTRVPLEINGSKASGRESVWRNSEQFELPLWGTRKNNLTSVDLFAILVV